MALGDDVSLDEVTAPNFDIRLPLPPGAKAPTSTTTPWQPEWTRAEVRIVVEGRAGLLNTGRLFCTTRPTPGPGLHWVVPRCALRRAVTVRIWDLGLV